MPRLPLSKRIHHPCVALGLTIGGGFGLSLSLSGGETAGEGEQGAVALALALDDNGAAVGKRRGVGAAMLIGKAQTVRPVRTHLTGRRRELPHERGTAAAGDNAPTKTAVLRQTVESVKRV